MKTTRAVTAAAICLAATQVRAQTPSFRGLGALGPGALYGEIRSTGMGVSPDGGTATGGCVSPDGYQPFRWTSADGTVGLGMVGSNYECSAESATTDGSVIVGYGVRNTLAKPFRWTVPGGMEILDDLPGGENNSRAIDISGDGSVIVGFGHTATGREPCRWTGTTPQGLGFLPGYSIETGWAAGISADGSVIVGESHDGVGYAPFRWTETDGMVPLTGPQGQRVAGVAKAASADGSVIVGMVNTAQGSEAFRWTATTGAVALGELPGGQHSAIAEDVSADGSIVVGHSMTSHQSPWDSAFIWDAGHGMRYLGAVLENDYGLDLGGWHITRAMAISDDGIVIVGYGRNASNMREAYVAVLPEPAALGLLAVGGLALVRKRRGIWTSRPAQNTGRRGPRARAALGRLAWRRRSPGTLGALIVCPSFQHCGDPKPKALPRGPSNDYTYGPVQAFRPRIRSVSLDPERPQRTIRPR
jgi:uncharacterized membrane protein